MEGHARLEYYNCKNVGKRRIEMKIFNRLAKRAANCNFITKNAILFDHENLLPTLILRYFQRYKRYVRRFSCF